MSGKVDGRLFPAPRPPKTIAAAVRQRDKARDELAALRRAKAILSVPDITIQFPRDEFYVYVIRGYHPVLFTGDLDVLYVGMTTDLLQRIGAHSRKDWWRAARRIDAYACLDGIEAANLEQAMIRFLRPVHNIAFSVRGSAK